MTHHWIARGGPAGIFGGALWALWPFGTPIFLAGPEVDSLAMAYGVSLIVPAALVLVGLRGIHELHRGTYARLGLAGTIVSAIAVVAMGIGLALDALGLGLGLEPVAVVGHASFLLGFFVLLIGSIVLGTAIYRSSRIPHARPVGLWLAVALPSGFVFQILADVARIPVPGEDFFFWMGLLTPYGLAWVVLGYSLWRVSAERDGQEGV